MKKTIKVFTNGCFDLLHVGHITVLKYCQLLANGGEVILGLDADEKIRRDKGELRPIFTYDERRQQLITLSSVLGKFTIFKFHTDQDLYDLIKSTEPDVIVKGSEYHGKRVIGDDLAQVTFCGQVHNISTSDIIDRIQRKEAEYLAKMYEAARLHE
jgi:D-beta-D-heptose 7-phosphate kinase/D-beta-D-heptose 1-phosphate adenosyltransferase